MAIKNVYSNYNFLCLLLSSSLFVLLGVENYLLLAIIKYFICAVSVICLLALDAARKNKELNYYIYLILV
jgi:hypothetical protein